MTSCDVGVTLVHFSRCVAFVPRAPQGDVKLNQACKILRLLHIGDLRELQTLINELVVQVQGITANPKTNSKLGKVGY